MAKDPEGQDLMGYEAMAQEALRGVVKSALKRAAGPGGLPGSHHFYITFKTRGAGVSIPPELVERYPEEMTIVVQHQFWDLAPGETFFSVSLKFGGQPKRLSMPYAAVTRFYDPSVPFVLQFEASSSEMTALPTEGELVPLRPREGSSPTVVAQSDEEGEAPAAASDEPKIVSLDQFRKK